MRLTTTSTWLRLALLFSAYLLIPLATRFWGDLFTTHPGSAGPTLFALILLLPAITVALSAWDGMRHGFSVLWQLAPFLFFLVPMYLFLNESALIYGVIYAVAGLAGNAIASLFYMRKQRI